MGKFDRLKLGILPAVLAGAVLGGAGLADASNAPAAGHTALATPSISAHEDAAAAPIRDSIVRSGQTSGVVTAAAGDWARCPNGYMCLFDGFDGTGHMAFFRTGSPNLAWQGIDKAASSQWNRSRWSFVLYEGYNYTGRHNGTEPPGSRWNFTYWGGNNYYSSIHRA